MILARLRDKVLLGSVAIGIVVALASMLAISWVISQQYLDQSRVLLARASRIINDSLDDHKTSLLVASRQLATQKNLGSAIWYLEQYAQSSFDRDMLFNTYQHLVNDTYKIGRVAKLSRVAIYDSAGNLVSFALFDGRSVQAGFVERAHGPVFQVAKLADGEEINRQNLRRTTFISGMSFTFSRGLPQQESVRYTVMNRSLAIESDVPIMGESLDPSTGKEKTKQLGLVTMVQMLDQAFVDRLSLLTDTKINVFIPQNTHSGGTVTYRNLDWNTAQQGGGQNLVTALDKIKIERESYYQHLIPLYTDGHLVGTIVALRSREIVRKNTWEMIRILGLIAFASLMLMLPFAWYFASSISLPLNILSRIFRGVGSGNQIGPLNDGQLKQLEKEKMRDDELGDLTQSFIAMNDAVNQKIQQINEINASLEHKIEKRTAELGLAKEMAESANRKLTEKNALLENMNIMLQHNELVLRNSEELLRETQIIAGLGTYVMDVATGLWKSSDVLDMLFGINETYQRTIEGWVKLVHPDDRTRLVDYLKKEVFEQCKAFDMEYRVIRYDDQAERWLHGVGKLEFDVQGRPSKMLCAVQDITEQREREAELATNRELLHDIEKRQTLSRERQRLMQDMHDGLGSSLISALSVVEHGRMSQAEIAQVLMGCIDDLKLAIDSMEPMEADLLLLLATLRFRLGPRLENIGITLRWEIENVPALDWLDPRNALHILRILQESFTNIIKHAHATEIRVATKVLGNDVVVTVTDNGQGFSLAQAQKNGGKGLFNQMRRAESIGAEISLDSNNDVGTCLTLRLPIKRKYGTERMHLT
ncbi:MAG: PAS domain-containing protein [Betaproteobacteria bacterium]|nr:PAS domain-containing protein [Betaproteobacteria bacterium]